jgi:predicted O-methyltransferase YrrM
MMRLFLLLFTATCLIGLPTPYDTADLYPFDGDGWFSNERGMRKLICKKKGGLETIIEVGSWLGASTRFLATQVNSGGKVYAVDTWQGSITEVVHQQDPRLPFLYEIFLSNTIQAGLTDVIVPVRMESLQAAEILDVRADLIYIDGDHRAESVYQDILAWYPHLKEGGIFCGDDWTWDSVREGVYRAASELDLEVMNNTIMWWLL